MRMGRIPAKYREHHEETVTTGTAIAPISGESYDWRLVKRGPPADPSTASKAPKTKKKRGAG
jgi:hypothetical protein